MLRDVVATGVGECFRVVGQHRLATERVVGLLERGVEDAALDVDVADVVEPACPPLGWDRREQLLRLDEIVVGDEESVVEREHPPVAEASNALPVEAADRGFAHHDRLVVTMQSRWKGPAAGDETPGCGDEKDELANTRHSGSVRG